MTTGGQQRPVEREPTNRTQETRPLRVLLADDHGFYRSGLRSMLAAEGLDVIEARSGRAAIELASASPPDVVLMDLHMPEMSGVEATRVLAETTAVPVVMLTVSADDGDVVEAVRAGARGYVLKDASPEEILAAARAAAAGDAWVSPRVAGPLLARVRSQDDAPPVAAQTAELSARERQVLRLIAGGRDNAAIGRELHLSDGTVRKHVSSILAKLGVDNRVEAAVYAVRNDLA
jgi:two-component system nitrate/nitrite response regulator NarL